jgi:phage/plasmid-like protein (TIGR03299 family)
MPAEVTVRTDGSAEMFSAQNIIPWHGLGTVVKDKLTAREAIIAAKLDWIVRKVPLSAPWNNGRIEAEGLWGIQRCDNGHILGSVKKNYHVIQNFECFAFFDEVVGSGRAIYDTAGSLNGGRRVWILADMKDEFDVADGDVVKKYILLYTTHDGNGALAMMFVTIRVVCSNTLSVALRGAMNVVKIRHTKGHADRAEDVQKALGFGNVYFNRIEKVSRDLRRQTMSEAQFKDFLRKLIPGADRAKRSTRTDNIRGTLMKLFKEGAGNIGTSRWDALNAVTEFTDHTRKMRKSEKRSDVDQRFDSIMFETGAKLKANALHMLLN